MKYGYVFLFFLAMCIITLAFFTDGFDGLSSKPGTVQISDFNPNLLNQCRELYEKYK